METKKKEMTYAVKPSAGIDISDTTATPSDVLSGKAFYGADGVKTSGIIGTYDGATSFTPTTSAQTAATGGKYVGSDISVGAIPSEYKDTTGTDATAGDILAGKKAVTGAGLVTGNIQTYSGAGTVTQNGTLGVGGKYVEQDIEVAVPSSSPTLITKQITANGTYNASSDNADGYFSVEVSVAAVSKLPQVVDRSVTSIDTADLQGVTKIGSYAFRDCRKLISVLLPNTITEIGNSAFNYCTILTSITIPNSVVKISSGVFSGCFALTNITILATTPPTLDGTNAIPSNVTTIYIPNGTLSAYQTATNWSSFSSRFVELPA